MGALGSLNPSGSVLLLWAKGGAGVGVVLGGSRAWMVLASCGCGSVIATPALQTPWYPHRPEPPSMHPLIHLVIHSFDKDSFIHSTDIY